MIYSIKVQLYHDEDFGFCFANDLEKQELQIGTDSLAHYAYVEFEGNDLDSILRRMYRYLQTLIICFRPSRPRCDLIKDFYEAVVELIEYLQEHKKHLSENNFRHERQVLFGNYDDSTITIKKEKDDGQLYLEFV